MKKIRLFTLLSLLVTLSLLLLVGCKNEDAISSIALKDHDPDTAIEIAVGDFDYGAYTLVATYKSGNTEQITLTKEMIDDADIVKLYQEGEHDVTVTYGDQKCTFKVSVKRSTFKDLGFSANNVFTYNGKSHVVEVEGNIPANAIINYVGGNSFVNVGTYDVIAIISCEGYVTERLSTTVKIEKAKYDMSGVKFEAKEFVYDGQSHSVSISGTLPEGVSSPTYFIGEKEASSAVSAGEYKVIAKFANKNPNYEEIPDMETTLKIIPAEYTVKGVEIVFKNEDGTLIDGTTKIYDGTSVLFDLKDYSHLSNKLSVSFSVLDKDGKLLSTSNKTTGIKDAGVYTVKAEFALADGKNYQPIKPLACTFEVLKAEHPPLAGVSLLSKQATYDGKAQSIKIDGQLPEGVTVSYEYYLGSTLIVDGDGKPVQEVIDAGIYTVKAVFAHTDANYGKISDASAILNIKKAEVNLGGVGFSSESTVEYSGNSYVPDFTKWSTINEADYDIFEYTSVKYYVADATGEKYTEMGKNELPTEVGMYRAVIDVYVANDYKNNYTLGDSGDVYTIAKRFEIVKKQLALPSVDFESDSDRAYTENAQKIKYTCDADASLMTVSTAYYKYATGKYSAMKKDEIPTNVGSYKFVVTVAIKDVAHYVLSSGEASKEYSFEFKINPKKIDISSVALKTESFVFNGTAQTPDLVIPEHVRVKSELYAFGGAEPIESAINVGRYSVEVELTPESFNYVLSSNVKIDFDFEITPKKIDVSNLEFDRTAFEYNGKIQQPILLDVPEQVMVNYDCYWGDSENDNSTWKDGKHLALDAGEYICKARLKIDDPNYELDGPDTYSTKFNVTCIVIDITELVSREIVLEYAEAGYEDDDLKKLVMEGMSSNVVCGGMGRYCKLDENGENPQDHGAYLKNVSVGRYVSKNIKFDARPNYVLKYKSEERSVFFIDIYIKIIEPSQNPSS